MQEDISRYKNKQKWMMVGMMLANLASVVGIMVYSWLKQQALLGAVYSENAAASQHMIQTLFHLKINGRNCAMASEALWQAGYTENGYLYLLNVSKELWIVTGAILFIVILAIIGMKHNFAVGKEDLMGKVTRIELENVELQKSLEQEHRYNENQKKQLQDFMENIAHQVRTPLAAISVKLGLLQELEKESAQESKQEARQQEDSQASGLLQSCVYNTFKIKAFITKLLNISRVESGKVIMAEDEVALETVIQESINGCGILPERIEMTGSMVGKCIYADEGWLIEAFINLISNCEDYIRENEEGRIFIDIQQDTENVTIIIADNGVGMKEADLPHIFNRFETTRESRDFHVGIGLNLSKLIVEAHHGRLHAGNSQEHGGAEFRVLLPVYHMKKKFENS